MFVGVIFPSKLTTFEIIFWFLAIILVVWCGVLVDEFTSNVSGEHRKKRKWICLTKKYLRSIGKMIGTFFWIRKIHPFSSPGRPMLAERRHSLTVCTTAPTLRTFFCVILVTEKKCYSTTLVLINLDNSNKSIVWLPASDWETLKLSLSLFLLSSTFHIIYWQSEVTISQQVWAGLPSVLSWKFVEFVTTSRATNSISSTFLIYDSIFPVDSWRWFERRKVIISRGIFPSSSPHENHHKDHTQSLFPT